MTESAGKSGEPLQNCIERSRTRLVEAAYADRALKLRPTRTALLARCLGKLVGTARLSVDAGHELGSARVCFSRLDSFRGRHGYC